MGTWAAGMASALPPARADGWLFFFFPTSDLRDGGRARSGGKREEKWARTMAGGVSAWGGREEGREGGREEN